MEGGAPKDLLRRAALPIAGSRGRFRRAARSISPSFRLNDSKSDAVRSGDGTGGVPTRAKLPKFEVSSSEADPRLDAGY